ncbi:unnamed protein product [Cochlearia groenlandica]
MVGRKLGLDMFHLLPLWVSRVVSITPLTSLATPATVKSVDAIILVARADVDALPGYGLGGAALSSVRALSWSYFLCLNQFNMCPLPRYPLLFLGVDRTKVADSLEFRCTGDAFALGDPHGLGWSWREYYDEVEPWWIRRKTSDNFGLGSGYGGVEAMDGKGTTQGGYEATYLMDSRDAWKHLGL